MSQVEVCECVVLCMKGAREGHEGMRGWVNELNQCWWHECEFEWMGLGISYNVFWSCKYWSKNINLSLFYFLFMCFWTLVYDSYLVFLYAKPSINTSNLSI